MRDVGSDLALQTWVGQAAGEVSGFRQHGLGRQHRAGPVGEGTTATSGGYVWLRLRSETGAPVSSSSSPGMLPRRENVLTMSLQSFVTWRSPLRGDADEGIVPDAVAAKPDAAVLGNLS